MPELSLPPKGSCGRPHMPRPFSPRLACLALAAAIAGVALPVFAAPAPEAAPHVADGIRQGEAQQAQIKNQIGRAADDLTSIINELNRNGIGGEDVKTLVKIRDILGDLTA